MHSPKRGSPRPQPLNSPNSDPSQFYTNNDFPFPSPMFAEPVTPSSPTILLSPSTPEFAPVSLPQQSHGEHEETFIDPGVTDILSGPGEDVDGIAVSEKNEGEPERKVDKKLRHSLMLLDTRLAELESMGFNTTGQSVIRSPTLVETTITEEDSPSQVSDFDAVNFMLARDSSFESSQQRDVSTKSLASVASGYSTHSSSEDAFDIVDFPSIDQLTLTSSYDLEQSGKTRTTVTPRDRSSDLMAFPIPPNDIPLIPFTTTPSSYPLGNKYEDGRVEDEVFEQLASLGQGESMQGLGLSSSTSTSRPSSRFALSETDADADSRSLCSNGSSSFEASTLASSYAPTPGFGQSTTSVNGPDTKNLKPVAISSSIYTRRAATAQSTMPSPSRIVPSRTFSVPATLGSPLSLGQDFPPSPSSLSPYSFSDSPVFGPSSTNRSYIRNSSFPPLDSNAYRTSAPPSPALSQSPSRQDVGFAELHQASLGLLGDFDGGGIPMWSIQPEDKYACNVANLEDEKEELLEEVEEKKSSSKKIEETSKPLKSFSSSSSLNPPSPSHNFPIGTLRRLSSFQILKKRKSENVLAPTTVTTTGSKRPVLSKPKSEMALSTLAKRQAQESDTIAEGSRDVASPTLIPPGRFGKLSLRSKTSPRIPQLASPSSPWSESSGTTMSPSHSSSGFSARPRALSFGVDKNDGGGKSPTATSTKKRFSILIPKQFGGSRQSHIPPVPPTPTEHLSTSPAISGTTSLVNGGLVDTKKNDDHALEPLEDDTSTSETRGSASLSPILTSNYLESPTTLSTSLPSTPATVASAEELSPSVSRDEAAFPLPTPPISSLDDPITLAAFLDYPPSSPTIPSIPHTAVLSVTPKQAKKGNESSQSPFGDRTNWSRPTSPALLDGRKPTSPFNLEELVVVPQQITIFPVRLPPVTAKALAEADAEQDDEECEDDYGGSSESEEDKPLGVVVPGALTAQKSLRKTISRKKNPKLRPKEDPFEFEQAAAMAQAPSTSRKSPRVTVPTSSLPLSGQSTQFDGSLASVIRTSQGHDSFLPQTDASIERKASSNGLRRSPSTPLNHMIANSALTLDSPVLTQEPLPIQQTILPSATVFPSRTSNSKSRDQDSSVPPLRSPPLNAPPRSRPPPIPSSSFDTKSELPSAPSLNRRPSLHPDVALTQTPYGMQRQPSNSSSQSSTNSIASPLPSPSLAQPTRPPVGGRSRSGTLANNASVPIEHRIYLGKVTAKHLVVKITDRTVAGEIVLYAKGRGALEGGNENEGGWALWEVWTSMGLERPLREYELVNDVLKSFDGEAAFVLRRTTLWPILSTHARVQPTDSKIGQVQIEMKKGKWSKRFLELRDGTLSYSKTEKGKDSTVLCQLSNFAVFFVDEAKCRQLKAPKPAVFALKSRLTRAHFEEVSQYCNFVSVKSIDESFGWISCITEAGNQQLRQREQAVLGISTVPNLPTSPLLASTPALSSPPLSAPAPASDAPILTRTSSANHPRTFLSRNTSARPAPSVLAPSISPIATGSTIARRPSAPSENDRNGISRESERKAKGPQVPLVDLSQ